MNQFIILTEYKSPQLETLGFDLVKAKLVNMGYPKEILQFEYDPSFPVCIRKTYTYTDIQINTKNNFTCRFVVSGSILFTVTY